MRFFWGAAFLWVALLVPFGAAGSQSGEGGEGPSHELAWKIANFAILAGGLGYLVYKKGGPFFRSRTESIRKDIEEARRLKQEAEARAAETDRRMARLQDEIDAMRRQAEQEIAAEGERLRQETEAALEKIRRHAEQEIEGAAKAARQEVRAHAAEMAVQLAAASLRSVINEETDGALISSFLEEVGRTRGGASKELN